MLDGFPSSHPISKPIENPYEIEEYFDFIESSKTAALLRMVEKEMTVLDLYNAFTVRIPYQAHNDFICYFFVIIFIFKYLKAFLNYSPFGIADVDEFYKALPPIVSLFMSTNKNLF